MHKELIRLTALPLALMGSMSAYAATAVDLTQQDISTVKKEFFAPATNKSLQPAIIMKEIRRAVDFNKTLHVRVMETYKGYPVIGGDSVVHIPSAGNTKAALANLINANSTINGKVFKNLETDLINTPAYIFNKEQADKALQQMITAYQQKVGAKPEISDQESKLMVYVDDNHKAHWVFRVNFYAEPVNGNVVPQKPIYIVDAVSFDIYEQWDDVKTEDVTDATLVNVNGGGNGGNEKMGKLVYDGGYRDLPALNVQRNTSTQTCYMQNSEVTVKKYINKLFSQVITYPCESVDKQHNNVYWRGSMDAVNGGYSPADDALFAGGVIKALYQDWYGIPVLTKDGKPMMLNMVVHIPNYENAYWDGKKMNFGDGADMMYPLTSLGVGAHEVSHGFTEQHSNLTYEHQSGGMNESFSDMAAQAAEVYAYGTNSWQIGPEIMKEPNTALRYMDQPSKDCPPGKQPGNGCSIDSADQYSKSQNVHYTSGVYNHLFYLIATSKGWNVRKAFDVMVQANRYYWTADSDYNGAACGVLRATRDYKYDTQTVKDAFAIVKVDPGKNC